MYNQIEKLASAIRNDVVSGLKGYHTNLSMSIEQLCQDIVDERLQILKEYSLKGILPLRDLYISINCITVDCKNIERCRCSSSSECPQTQIAHFEIPQILGDYGQLSIDYIGYNWFYNTESVSNTTQKGLNKKVNPIELLTEVRKINEKNFDDPIINYFYYRYMVWYLLFSGKKATAKEFIKEYKKLSNWLKENNIKLHLNFTSKKIKSEPIKNR